MPVAFGRLGGAQNHAPVHFLTLRVAQARGLEHLESFKARQARSLNPSGSHFELLVRGVCTFSVQQEMAAQGHGGEKRGHSSRETLKNASRAPPEQLQTMCLPCFRAKGVLQSTYLCIRRNLEMHRYMVWSDLKAPKCGGRMLCFVF